MKADEVLAMRTAAAADPAADSKPEDRAGAVVEIRGGAVIVNGNDVGRITAGSIKVGPEPSVTLTLLPAELTVRGS